ncbi:MAG TPA: recombinase family protein, partial [Herpetosiphonaceae bacterium]
SGAHSYTKIADDLNALGYRALDWRSGERRLFGRESIRTILRNRAYCGYVTSGGEEYRGAHEPLVSEEAWDLCAELRGERHGSHHSPEVKTPALLIQRAGCAICGGKMWIHRSGGQARPAWFYRCSGNSKRTCDASMVDVRKIDELLVEMLGALTLPPEWIPDVTAQAEALLAQTAPVISIDRAAIETQMRRYALIFAEGMISEEEYAKKKVYLQDLLKQAAAAPAVQRPRLDRAVELLANLGASVEVATVDERRMIIRAIFTTVWIEGRRLKAVTPTDAFLHLIGVMNGVRVADGLRPPPHTKHHPRSI